jgi:hypothetical protein
LGDTKLKDHLIKGYTINQKRLEELQQTVRLISNNIDSQNTKFSEAKGIIEIIKIYTQSFILLNQFDSSTLKSEYLNDEITYAIKYHNAKEAIHELKTQLIKQKEATPLFGNEKDDSFRGILGILYKVLEENICIKASRNRPHIFCTLQ